MDAAGYVSPVVVPETVTIPLSNGDKIVVKKKLNQGEKRRADARCYNQLPGGGLGIVPGQIGLAMVTAYLLDWTVRGLDGKTIEILRKPIEEVEAALDSLSPEMYDEIKTAIQKHEDDQIAAAAKEKNDRDGEQKSSAILPSADGTAGDTSTSKDSIQTSMQ